VYWKQQVSTTLNQTLIKRGKSYLWRLPWLALYDPDTAEMKEYAGIDIFVPGTWMEREIDWDRLFHVLVLTGAAFGLMVLFAVIIMIPMMAAGLIYIDLVTLNVYIDPVALFVVNFASIGLMLPPIWYVKSNGYSLKSIGLSSLKSAKEAIIGLGVGVLMLGANLAVTFLIESLPGGTGVGDEALFVSSSELELAVWVIVMFGIVGLSEELLMRGFLQRRMELYFSTRRSRPGLYALLITSFVFAAMHLDIIGLPLRFVLGLFLGGLAQRRNYSITGPTMAHGFNNAAFIVLAYLGF
jgi:membrane protease YdiL (CAAX protease family)